MAFNKDLRQCLVESTNSRSNLFKKYTDIGKLLKPNGLIMKPIFCVFVLKHTMPKQPQSFNWNDRDDLKGLWMTERKQIRNTNFVKSLYNFDVM